MVVNLYDASEGDRSETEIVANIGNNPDIFIPCRTSSWKIATAGAANGNSITVREVWYLDG